MGTVQIKLHQVRTYDPEGYKIENEIMTAPDETEGISPDLFVFSYVDGTHDLYQHVATVEDIAATPERNGGGWNIYGQFFRQRTATLVYSNITAAEEQAALIKLRLQELTVEYDADVEAYDVTTNYTYKSSDNYVSIGLRQVGTQPGDELFRMVSTFPAATPPAENPLHITAFLFVYKYVDGSTDTYARIATIDDINTLPEEDEEGWDTEDQYYRKISSTVEFTTLSAVELHGYTQRAALSALAQDYREYTNVFEGDEEIVYSA
jgi:hypothetical protein